LLLQYIDWQHLDEEDVEEFCNKHHNSIVSIISEYFTIMPTENYEKGDDDYYMMIAIMSLLYMMYGKDDEVVDRKIQISDSEEDYEELIESHPFISSLLGFLYITALIESLRSDNLITAVETSEGIHYHLTELGEGVAECLVENPKK